MNEFLMSEADVERIKKANESEDQYLEDLQFLMRQQSFVRVVKHWLLRLGISESIWRGNSSMGLHAARSDAAREIMGDMFRADRRVAEGIHSGAYLGET